MTRGLGIVFVLITLAITGVLFVMQDRSSGPASPAVTRVESQALVTAAAANFAPADQLLQVDHAQAGTYAGAALPEGSGVTLARATDTSYCLETNLDGTFAHENGPGGSPAPGRC
jgi:hypothetical protein